MSDDARLLPGFGLAGYRSFFDDVRLFAPLGKITLLAGQNNAGKSNVLRFAHLFLTERPPALEPLDEPRLPDDVPYGNPLRLAVARTVTAQDAEALLPTSADNSVEMVALAHLLDSAPVRGEAPTACPTTGAPCAETRTRSSGSSTRWGRPRATAPIAGSSTRTGCSESRPLWKPRVNSVR